MQYDLTVTDRNKSILSECTNVRTTLDDGTFVIVAGSRLDMMRASLSAWKIAVFQWTI